MSVIASHPKVHLLPSSVAFRIGAYLRDGVIHDAQRIAHDLRVLSLSVRSFVYSGESDERESHSLRSQTPRCLLSYFTVNGQPPSHIAPKMGRGGASDERGTLADSFASPQATSYDAQCAEAWFGELENGWRSTIDVTIHQAHLGADVAPRMSRQSRDTSGAVVPAQAGQSDAAWISSHQERSVRGTSHRWKRGCDGGELSLIAQCGQRGKLTAVDGASEYVRSHPIRYDNDYLCTITWRALCRRTQLSFPMKRAHRTVLCWIE